MRRPRNNTQKNTLTAGTRMQRLNRYKKIPKDKGNWYGINGHCECGWWWVGGPCSVNLAEVYKSWGKTGIHAKGGVPTPVSTQLVKKE